MIESRPNELQCKAIKQDRWNNREADRQAEKAFLQCKAIKEERWNNREADRRAEKAFSTCNKCILSRMKPTDRDIELPAKLLDYFLRSNKSNTNQASLLSQHRL